MAKINPDITILGEYQGSAPKILVRCNVCGKEWMASPNNLLRGRGCQDCYKRSIKGRKLSIKKLRYNFEEKLVKINPGVSVISNYKSSTDKIVVRCNDCGCEYITTPSQLLNGGGRCPACKISSSGRKSKIVHGPIYFGGPSEAEYFVQTVNRLDDEQKRLALSDVSN
jgi:Zn finger protein HypA/HybF involved in hydrogenase expression